MNAVMVRFTKMQGAGNSFVCLDAVAEPALAERDLAALAVALSDRRSGAGGTGADGLIVIERPDPTLGLPGGRAVAMRMFNADGSESPMCGNGVRCVAKYALEHGLVEPDRSRRLIVWTKAGALEAACRMSGSGTVEAVTVDMGRPRLELADVPVDERRLGGGPGPSHRLHLEDAELEAVFVSMGNPHAVIFVENVDRVEVARLGPILETHAAFPDRMNVHFVEVAARVEVLVRTWERGSGITAACGSGACAVCVAGVVAGCTERGLLVHTSGGELEVEWSTTTDHVLLTGPVVEEGSGKWEEG